MNKKIDYKKDYKEIYLPKTKPEIIDVPPMWFITFSGSGDPNQGEFGQAVEALYSLSYAVRMSYNSENVPEGYYQYTVFPLEGVWDLLDYTKTATDKSNLKYTIMIRQPDFLTEHWFQYFLKQVKEKKPNPYLDGIRFEQITDGRSCQMMHIGSFDDEPTSFRQMEAFCDAHSYIRTSKVHREIYLSDPRKTEKDKLRTVLRYSVKAVE